MSQPEQQPQGPLGDDPANLIVLGLPGSGKTTLGELMASDPESNMAYISVGQISRELLPDDPRRSYVDNLYRTDNRPTGDPHFFLELVKPAIQDAIDNRKGIILDGIPKKPEEISPLNDMLTGMGVKVDGVVVCQVSPFTALQRVISRGDREGGLDTFQTAVNRGAVFWDSIDEIRRSLGGFLGARIIEVDTDLFDPQSAVSIARGVLESIRAREASATVLDIKIPERTLDIDATDSVISGLEQGDNDRVLRGLTRLFIADDERPVVDKAIEAQISGDDVTEAIKAELNTTGEYTNTPLALHRRADMIQENQVGGLNHLAHILNLEPKLRADASGKDVREHIEEVIREIAICQEILNHYQGGANNLASSDKFIDEEFALRKGDIPYIEAYLKEHGGLPPEVSMRRLMSLQTDYWNIFTGSAVVGSIDANYQKRINSLPGSHHSLAPPVNMPRSLIANSIGEYRPFIEAVSSSNRAGFQTSFGFLHAIGVDQAGRAFQVEWPLMMYDAELADHPNALLRDMLSRGQQIYFNHDFWHNLVPVYAESFNLYHAHAPIAYGGILDAYKDFGKKLRTEKEEYEIMVAMNHSRSQQYRMERDPSYGEEQVSAAISIMQDLQLLRKQLIDSDGEVFAKRVVTYFATETAGRLLNVLPPDHPSLGRLIDYLSQDETLVESVPASEVIRLLFTQRAILASNESRLSFMQDILRFPGVPDELREAIISHLLPTIGEAPKKEALPQNLVDLVCSDSNVLSSVLHYIEYDHEFAESGSRELFTALKDLGFEDVLNGNSSSASIRGLNLLRWYAIIAPQRAPLKGHMEKVHGKEKMIFGDELIHPAEVVNKQYQALTKDRDVYEYRRWAREYGQQLSSKIYNLLFDDGQPELRDERATLYILSNYRGHDDEQWSTVAEGMKALDELLAKLVKTDYTIESELTPKLQTLSNISKKYGQQLSAVIDEIIESFGFLQQQETAYQSFARTNYSQAKSALEESTMSLTE